MGFEEYRKNVATINKNSQFRIHCTLSIKSRRYRSRFPAIATIGNIDFNSDLAISNLYLQSLTSVRTIPFNRIAAARKKTSTHQEYNKNTRRNKLWKNKIVQLNTK